MNVPMGAMKNGVDGSGVETKKTTRKSSQGADKGGSGSDSYKDRLEAVKQEQHKLKGASSS